MKIFRNIFNFGKDSMIKNLLKAYNIKYTILIYELITYSPLDSVITILCGKLGLSKAVILIILAFIL